MLEAAQASQLESAAMCGILAALGISGDPETNRREILKLSRLLRHRCAQEMPHGPYSEALGSPHRHMSTLVGGRSLKKSSGGPFKSCRRCLPPFAHSAPILPWSFRHGPNAGAQTRTHAIRHQMAALSLPLSAS